MITTPVVKMGSPDLSSNGRTAWVIEGAATSYGEWQAEQVNRVAPPGTGAEPEMPAVVPASIEDDEA